MTKYLAYQLIAIVLVAMGLAVLVVMMLAAVGASGGKRR